MKNIEFRATNKHGLTFVEKFDGRKLTSFVAKEAAERNIRESKVISDFVTNHFIKYYSNEEITSFEFTWLGKFNQRCKIEQSGIELIGKEIFTRVKRFTDEKCNYANKDNKTLFDEWYDWVDIFYDGFAIVRNEDMLFNFFDKQGKLLSEEWFKWVDIFRDGFADVQRTNGEYCKIDKQGKIVSVSK